MYSIASANYAFHGKQIEISERSRRSRDSVLSQRITRRDKDRENRIYTRYPPGILQVLRRKRERAGIFRYAEGAMKIFLVTFFYAEDRKGNSRERFSAAGIPAVALYRRQRASRSDQLPLPASNENARTEERMLALSPQLRIQWLVNNREIATSPPPRASITMQPHPVNLSLATDAIVRICTAT